MEQDTPVLPDVLAAPGTDPVEPAPAENRRGTFAKSAGIVVTGLVVGALGVAALQGSGSASATGTTPAAGFQQGPGGQLGTPPGGFTGRGGPGGGVAGETRVAGTLTAVGASSLTVTEQDGTTTTVPVNASTEIVRNGASASLSDLVTGESVFVHVVPSGTGTIAERVFAGTQAGGPGVGPPPGRQQGSAAGNGPVSTT